MARRNANSDTKQLAAKQKPSKRKRSTQEPCQHALKRPKKQSQKLVEHVSKIPALPTELIINIAQYLAPESVSNFRLCCHRFAEIGLPLLLREKVVFIETHSLLNLQRLCQDPYSQHIRSLHFELDAFKDPAISCDQFIDEVMSSRQMAAKHEFMARNRDAIHNQPFLTRTSLKQAFDTYNFLVHCQREIYATARFHLTIWKTAIHMLPNLESITLSSDNHIRPNAAAKNPFKKYTAGGIDHLWDTVGVREFRSVLFCAQKAEKNLKTFQAGQLHWSAFRGLSHQPRELKMLLAPLQNLTTLRLVISSGYDDELECFGLESEQCALELESGGLAAFIRGLHNLQTLSVEFDGYDEETFTFPAEFESILDPRGHWPYLHTLRLSFLDSVGDIMIDFFQKHQETLKELYLSNIYITDALCFFSEMQKLLNLDVFEISESLWSYEDDEDASRDDLWWLGWPECKNHVRSALTNFVQYGGEYPLEHDRVRELEEMDEPDPYAAIRAKFKDCN